MSEWCSIHMVPLLLKRMNGGWTSVCPWCDAMGKYERIGAHEAAQGYPRRSTGSGVVGYGYDDTYDRRAGNDE